MPGHGWQQVATDAVHAHLVETQIRPRLSVHAEISRPPTVWGPFLLLPNKCIVEVWLCTGPRVAPPSSLASTSPLLTQAVSLTSLATTVQCCAEAGVLGRWGFALESAADRVCREAGAWVGTNF